MFVLSKALFQESNFLTYNVSRQDRELLEMADFRNLCVCLCMPKGHNWENATIAGTGEMKGRKAFWAVESGDHKNLGLILRFPSV